MRSLLCFFFLIISIDVFSQTINLNVGGETGNVDSGLPTPLVESYSRNGNSSVNGNNGAYVADNLHYISVDSVNWAREGNYVLKFYGDGSNFPNFDYAYRVELATSPQTLKYTQGEERYYSLSFLPPQHIWDSITQYSTVITQWKQYGGGNPNAEIRLSNEGDYRLTIRSVHHWMSSTSDGDLFGHATPGEWNDLKYYVKHSEYSDGAIKVWLNGELSYDYSGPTMYTTADGYVKFGMYTEIRDERILYFDGINITDSITTSLEDWSNDQMNLPEADISYPNDNDQLNSSSLITITANANDPAGNQLGTIGSINYVEFFVNGVSLGVDSTVPYTYEWNPIDGPYSMYVTSIDNDSNTVISNEIEVYVGPYPPEVEITSPNHLANFENFDPITIYATASDIDGSITQVEFFVDSTSIGIDYNSPYSINWTPTDSAAFIISTIATDTDNKTSNPDYIGITFGAVFDTLAIGTIHDASLREANPNSAANWSKVEVYSNANSKIAGVFKFDIDNLQSYEEIRDAKLKLYTYSLDDSLLISIHKAIGDNWDESSVTWNNGPTRGTNISNMMVNQTSSYFEFDVKDYVIENFQEGDSLITIWIEDSIRTYNQVEFDSHTRPNPPILNIITSSIAGAEIFNNNSTTNNNPICYMTDSVFACDSLLWIDGNTYFSNNTTASHTVSSNSTCDTVYTLNLTIGSSNFTLDTTSFYIGNASFAAISPIVELGEIDTIVSNIIGCESIIYNYNKFVYSPTVFDTITSYDTIWSTITDTLYYVDSSFVNITNYDTVWTTLIDTSYFIDTSYVNITNYDTVWTTLIDTSYFIDTSYVNITTYDTVFTSVQDTLIISLYSTAIPLISDTIFDYLKIYPNPTNSILNVVLGQDNTHSYDLTVTNSGGQSVYIEPSFVSSTIVDVSSFSAGMYYIKITDNNTGFTSTKVLLIE